MNSENTTSGRDEQTVASAYGHGHHISIFDVLLVLIKHWKTLLGVPVLVAVITGILTLFIPNVYTAKALIFPADDTSGGLMNAMMAQMGGLAALAGGGGGGTKADLYVTILKSETVKDPIIDRFNLMELYQAEYRAKVYADLEADSNISAGKKDGVITVAVNSKDPKLAANVANAYVEELGKLLAKVSMSGAGANRIFLEERLAKAEADLRAAEESLKVFQTKNKAVAVTDQAKATLDGVAQLRAQLVAQEVQLAALRQQFSDGSSEVKSARASISSLRSEIDRLEGSESRGTLPGVGAMPRLGQEYMRLMRDFKVQETLVELLTKQYEMTKLNEAKDVAPFQVLQRAKVPEVKTNPKRLVIVAMAGLLSFFMVAVAILVRKSLVTMKPEDLSQWQEVIAMLPLPPRFKGR